MNLYQEHILDHYKNPRNVGELSNARSARDVNTLCGDEVTVYVSLRGAERRGNPNQIATTSSRDDMINRINHISKGCAITIASASILSEELVGKTATQIEKLTEADILKIINIELTPARTKCAMLPVWTLKKALSQRVIARSVSDEAI